MLNTLAVLLCSAKMMQFSFMHLEHIRCMPGTILDTVNEEASQTLGFLPLFNF